MFLITKRSDFVGNKKPSELCTFEELTCKHLAIGPTAPSGGNAFTYGSLLRRRFNFGEVVTKQFILFKRSTYRRDAACGVKSFLLTFVSLAVSGPWLYIIGCWVDIQSFFTLLPWCMLHLSVRPFCGDRL